jgi:hypothetical protein
LSNKPVTHNPQNLKKENRSLKKNIIGIISDTHDNRKNIVNAVDIFNRKETGLVIHAGDFVAPFTSIDFKKLNCPMEMVFGNNDGEKIGLANSFKGLGNLLPGPRSFLYNGKKILLMHEEGCLDEIIKSSAVDIIVYGHTHEVDIRHGRPLVVNPGEAGGWLKGKSTIAILDLDKMDVEVIDLNP